MIRRSLSRAPALLLALLLALGGLGLAGCGSEESNPEETPQANTEGETPEATEETPEATEETPEPEIAAAEVPVEDDFADEAAEQITTENYADELANLEQEIQSEAGEGAGEEGESE